MMTQSLYLSFAFRVRVEAAVLVRRFFVSLIQLTAKYVTHLKNMRDILAD